MNKFAKLMLVVAGFLTMAACGKTAPNASTDSSAIRSSQDAWYKGFNSGDGAGVAALYADDAVLMAPNLPAAHGIVAIREYYSKAAPEFQASGLNAVEGPIGDIGMSGDLAWQSTTYTVTDKSGATVEAGKILTVLQRGGGKWMIIRDTWNSDAPPASAK
jgi:ketosteroid isomerase-like protein